MENKTNEMCVIKYSNKIGYKGLDEHEEAQIVELENRLMEKRTLV